MAAPPTPHSPQAYAGLYRQALHEAEALVAGLSPAPFNWKPGPGRWSVAECLVHLNTLGESYLPALEQALGRATVPGSPPFEYGFVGRMFIRFTSPESGRRIRTAPEMDPSKLHAGSSFEKDAVLGTFAAQNEAYVRLCEQAEGLDLTRVRMASPFLRVMRLQVGAYLEALGGHALRHVAQARRVTETPGFPVA